MDKIKTVYISSAYTQGDVAQNVRRQFAIADQLRMEGFLPYVPLASHFWHMIFPHPYDFWLDMDLEWLDYGHFDAVLRLTDVPSKGADMECKKALEIGIPVFYSVEKLLEAVGGL
jgi:hypothetical protein